MVVEVKLLGGFEVRVDGDAVPDAAWRRRQAASLVKVLALAPGGSLHREQVIDALWPDLAVDEAAPRLHKAAHYARRAIGDGTVVLRGEVVSLVDDGRPDVDLDRFLAAAEDARRDGGAEAADAALALWTGPLLPTDLYEGWAEGARDRADGLHQALLRQAGRWDALVDLDPTDEEAHVALMRALDEAGDHRGALRQYERLDRALRRELGVGPGPAAVALHDQLVAAGPAPDDATGLVGRDAELRVIDEARLAAARSGRALFVSGPPGIGKTALVGAAADRARSAGWRVGSGAASLIEGAWPYAPILEALADLCRAHPDLLDRLDGSARGELQRAMAGEDLAWEGDAPHRRLFLAAGELTRLATEGPGALLVLDDAHEADDATLRLVHHLVRSAARRPLLVLLGHRTPPGDRLDAVRASLVERGAASDLAIGPLPEAATRELVRATVGDVDDATFASIWSLSDGVPWTALEAARARGSTPLDLPDGLRDVLQRVAVTGTTFDTDLFVALSGRSEAEAFAHLDSALAAGVVEPDSSGYRFRHQLVRDALLGGLPEHSRRAVHRDAATRLAEIGASPARIGHHLVAAGDRAAAAPHLVRAAHTAAALGAHREALDLLDEVGDAASGADAAALLALRALLLTTLGDARALPAYRAAVEQADGEARRPLLAGMARAALMSGDLDAARAALEGVEPDGGPSDPSIFAARGMLAYLSGDHEGATAAVDAGRALLAHGDIGWLDLVALQGMLAHHRGEWFERLRVDLGRTRDEPDLARALFDGHLCVAEYLLYGPTPYAEVIDLALALKQTAARSGAVRAEAFAAALVGEAALLSGDLDAAEVHLREAIDLHREIGATAGEGHSLQRLAELHLARGDREAAEVLLQRSLRLARWSSLASHLVQRVYGSLIQAAPDAAAARAVVDRAAAETGVEDRCRFCQVMLDVPATIACADAGDLTAAVRYLAAAERSAAAWPGTAWQGSVLEARAHVLAAQGHRDDAVRVLEGAVRSFTDAGQPLDVARCAATTFS